MKTIWISVALAAMPASLFPAEVPARHREATNVVRVTPGYVNELVEVMRTNHPALRALDAACAPPVTPPTPRLLNRELHSPLPKFTLPDVAPPVAYNSNLVKLAVKYEPKLRLMDREIRAAEAQVFATRKSRLPDLSAGVEGRQYSGDGGFQPAPACLRPGERVGTRPRRFCEGREATHRPG